MATRITSIRPCSYGDGLRFRTEKGYFYVEEFVTGIAIASPPIGRSIRDFIEDIVGCFDKESNFEKEIKRIFQDDTSLKAIVAEVNDTIIAVREENADADKVYEEFRTQTEENDEYHRKKWEEYKKTDEYKFKHAKELKKEYRKEQVKKEVVFIDETTEFQFKNKDAKQLFEELKSKNDDGYGKAAVEYAVRYAKFMQHLMDKHNVPLKKIADNASYLADIDFITGFQFGCAAYIISMYWFHGEEFRKWHNGRLGISEDHEGVANPAVLTIG